MSEKVIRLEDPGMYTDWMGGNPHACCWGEQGNTNQREHNKTVVWEV